jgi:hypothetical protein
VTAQQLLWLPVGLFAVNAVSLDRPSDAIPQVAYFAITAVVAAAMSGVVLGVRGASRSAALVPIGLIALNYGLGLWPVLGFEQKPPWTWLIGLTGPAQIITLVAARTLSHRSRAEPSTMPPS